MRFWIIPFVEFALFMTACGQKPSGVLTDVGSDIPNGGMRLYWASEAEIFSGQCESGKPLLRNYCQQNLISRGRADAENTLFAGAGQKKENLSRDASELRSQLAAIDEALAADPTNIDLSAERARVARDLATVRDALADVTMFTDQVQGFFSMISKSQIVYKIDANGDRYQEFKPLVKALAAFFAQVPPLTPDATWTDAETKRTFAAIKDRYSWNAAQTACQQIRVGTWIALRGFLTGNCADDAALGKRLFTSTLMDAIPATTGAGLPDGKTVWSRCYYNNGLPVAISSDASGTLKHTGLSSSRQLPVVCERVK